MKGQPLSVPPFVKLIFCDRQLTTLALLELRVAICKQLNAAPYLGGVHSISLGQYYGKRPLSAVKAGSVFFGRICTSVVNLAPASTRASAFI